MSLRFLTAGESHGPELVAILEGLPAGLEIDREGLNAMLARRQAGFGSGGRMRIERDTAVITAGVLAGTTTGAPVAIRIENRDYANWRDRSIAPMTVPRPGHADLAAAVKYNYGDLRLGLERASARETAARTAVGAVCAQLLGQVGVRIGSYVTAIGDVEADLPSVGEVDYPSRFANAEASEVRCPDPVGSENMQRAIEAAIRDRDTLGGVFEVVALAVPPGLGSHVHYDRRLTGRILAAMGSIPAIKGAEIGSAFANARRRGTEVHARLAFGQADAEAIRRVGSTGGGIEGGITTGEPLVVRAAMKPISTTLTPLQSVDLATGRPAETAYERSDFCAVPRAAVVGEAMLAFVLAEALLELTGGDTVADVVARVEALRRNTVDDLQMWNRPWRFAYEPGADSEAGNPGGASHLGIRAGDNQNEESLGAGAGDDGEGQTPR